MSVRSELLTEEENKEFELINKVKPTRNDVVRVSIVYAVWMILTFGSVISVAHYDATGDDLQYPFIALMIVCLLLTALPILMGWRADIRAKEARDKRVATFKKRIRYERRSRPGYSGGSSAVSRRQMQHEWYGDNPDLDWQDRERAEMFGLDVETYRSNMLENDRD